MGYLLKIKRAQFCDSISGSPLCPISLFFNARTGLTVTIALECNLRSGAVMPPVVFWFLRVALFTCGFFWVHVRSRSVFYKLAVSDGVSIAVLKHHSQHQLGKKGGYFRLQVSGHWGKSWQELEQGGNLEVGNVREGMEEYRLVACLLRLLSYSTQGHKPRACTATLRWVLLCQ